MSQRKRKPNRNYSSFNTLSQKLSNEVLNRTKDVDIDIDQDINNLVRYILFRTSKNNNMFKKSDLLKNVISKSEWHFDELINRSRDVLKNIYGFNLITYEQESGGAKCYIVSNALPYVNIEKDNYEDKNDFKNILLLLILSHIFMSNTPVSERSLYAFLKFLKINPEKKHPLFGDIRDYIMNFLVKQKYLECEIEAMSKRTFFSWGIKAELEIKKQDLLLFVCKMYNCKPKTWTNQVQAADEQGFKMCN